MVKAQCRLYEERRNTLCEGLKSIGFEAPDSMGSMFVWAKIPEGHGSSMDFCLELMDKAGIICTPGASFGPMGEGYVRFALVLPPEEIKEAILAMTKAF